MSITSPLSPLESSKTWILAIDTSTEACSCALGDGVEVFTRYTDVPRKHAEQVLPMVEALLDEAGVQRDDVAAVAFGQGPGAFTGLRIAASVVQGLAFAWDVPVIPVSSLHALAQRALRENGWRRVIASIDARMGEIYWGVYAATDTQSIVHEQCADCLTKPSALALPDDLMRPNKRELDADFSCYWGVGTGWQYHNDMASLHVAPEQHDSCMLTHAQDVLTIAREFYQTHDTHDIIASASDAVPVYLRNNVVQR